jgi:uncharacterized protein YjbJ (UPF0337 family)
MAFVIIAAGEQFDGTPRYSAEDEPNWSDRHRATQCRHYCGLHLVIAGAQELPDSKAARDWNVHPNGVSSRCIQRVFRDRDMESEKMNWDQIKGKWTQFKGKAKEQWGDLTDDDLDRAEGKRDQLAGRVQERYGIAKEEAERQVDEWLQRL